jgi:hypothetical protein
MRRKNLYATDGETISVSNQWAAESAKRGATVSNSAWQYTGDGSLASAALTGALATVLLTPRSCGTVVNTATLSNGETLVATRSVVMDTPPPRDYA